VEIFGHGFGVSGQQFATIFVSWRKRFNEQSVHIFNYGSPFLHMKLVQDMQWKGKNRDGDGFVLERWEEGF